MRHCIILYYIIFNLIMKSLRFHYRVVISNRVLRSEDDVRITMKNSTDRTYAKKLAQHYSNSKCDCLNASASDYD